MRTTSYITGYPLDYAEKIFMSSTVKPFGYLKKPFQMELLKLYVERLSKGKAKHGFGMEIIEHITKFYEGTVSTNYDNQFLRLSYR